MDRRLTPARGTGAMPRGRRRIAWLALIVVVTLLHGAITRELANRLTPIDVENAMPERINVAYLRTIELAAPAPPTARVAPAAAEPPPRAPRRVARAASEAAASASPDAPALVAEASPAVDPAPIARPADPLPDPVPTPAAESTAPVADAASAAGAFEWPASTRVSYVLTGNYRGEVSGQAQVEWIRLGDRYQVNLDLLVGPEFAPLITRRMTSEGSIAASGLVPARYDEDTQVVFRERRRLSVVFESDAVVLGNGQRRERLPGVQDTASQFVQLTYLFSTQPELLRVGNAIAFPLALPRTMDSWTYDVVAEQTLIAPFGALQAFHLKPRPRPVRKSNELSAEMWIAPDLRFLPVRIRIEQDTATYIDLMISKKPEMAALAAASSSASQGKTP